MRFLFSSVIFLLIVASCAKKPTQPKAIIKVIKTDNSIVVGAEVTFYVESTNIKQNSINVTLVTNEKGEVTYTTSHECYPDVFVKYTSNGISLSASSNLDMKENTVTMSTIMIK